MQTFKKKDINKFTDILNKGMEMYKGFRITKNAVNYYEAENLKDSDEPLLWAKTKEMLKMEIDDKLNDEVNEEEIDELVNSRGGGISGDEKSVNNSEIKTAPQATSDDFNQAAIQPNRYLYNINGTGYSRGARVTGESENKIAKNKMISLLNEMDSNEPIVDMNNDDIEDITTLTPNVINKLKNLVDTVNVNNLTSKETEIVINYILNKLGEKLGRDEIANIKNFINNA